MVSEAVSGVIRPSEGEEEEEEAVIMELAKGDFQMVADLEAAEAADFRLGAGIWSDRITSNPFLDRRHLDYRPSADRWPMAEERRGEEEEEGTPPRSCRLPVLSLMPTRREEEERAAEVAVAAASTG